MKFRRVSTIRQRFTFYLFVFVVNVPFPDEIEWPYAAPSMAIAKSFVYRFSVRWKVLARKRDCTSPLALCIRSTKDGLQSIHGNIMVTMSSSSLLSLHCIVVVWTVDCELWTNFDIINYSLPDWAATGLTRTASLQHALVRANIVCSLLLGFFISSLNCDASRKKNRTTKPWSSIFGCSKEEKPKT